ncbi:MAG TPA: hydrogenase maturation protease [Acetobacteraceae bacterium]|nr:hydrogenase maturation protease [Acetobacteraceae bacterium]
MHLLRDAFSEAGRGASVKRTPAQHAVRKVVGERAGGPVILCLGNPDCGDDGAGRLLARSLRGRIPPCVRIEERPGAAVELLERLHGLDAVFLVDAALTGAAPGTIHVFDCVAEKIPAVKPGASSHGLGVAEALALARVLGTLPRVCRLYAIEGENFALGAALSPAVRTAVEGLAARLARELVHTVPLSAPSCGPQ